MGLPPRTSLVAPQVVSSAHDAADLQLFLACRERGRQAMQAVGGEGGTQTSRTGVNGALELLQLVRLEHVQHGGLAGIVQAQEEDLGLL